MHGWVCGADILKQATCKVHKPICIQFDAYTYPRLFIHHGILNLSGFAAPHIFQSHNWNDEMVPAVLISWCHYGDCTMQIPDAGGALKSDLWTPGSSKAATKVIFCCHSHSEWQMHEAMNEVHGTLGSVKGKELCNSFSVLTAWW